MNTNLKKRLSGLEQFKQCISQQQKKGLHTISDSVIWCEDYLGQMRFAQRNCILSEYKQLNSYIDDFQRACEDIRRETQKIEADIERAEAA